LERSQRIMSEIKVINLADKKEYTVIANKQGENAQVCPVCSESRRKKLDKCFSFNAVKGAGMCSHCGVVLVEKKEFTPKPTKIEYKRPLFKSGTSYSPDVIKFFSARKISEKTLSELKVSEGIEWMPKAQGQINTIQFNYFRNGELINVKYRGKGKDFKLCKDAELIFYNLDCTIHNNTIVIVEGEMDALALYECGFKNVISVPNGASLGKINFDYLDNCIDSFADDTKFIIAVDNDQAGQNLQAELVRRLGAENCSYVRFKDCKDANDCLIKYGIIGITESMNEAKEFPIEGVFTANDIEEGILNFYNNGLPKGCGVGMGELDMHLRYVEGYLTMITGIPGHGKSEFLDFILCRLNISHDWKAALYSPENHPMELHFSKFAEKITGKPFEGADRMSPTDLRTMMDWHSKNFFFINPKEDFTLDTILAAVKSLIRKKGVKSFVIDAWNKLDHKYTGIETKYISEELDKITKFCQRNNVHCFLVAHPTKVQKVNGQFEVPTLYSISGSANFYNKTANGITVHRNFETGQTEIHFQKIKFKHWGQTGTVILAWDHHNGRYYKGMPNYDNWLNMIEPKKEPVIESKPLEANNDFLNDIVVNTGDHDF
jgi:twinkle protein